jgi:hypothetical protein
MWMTNGAPLLTDYTGSVDILLATERLGAWKEVAFFASSNPEILEHDPGIIYGLGRIWRHTVGKHLGDREVFTCRGEHLDV